MPSPPRQPPPELKAPPEGNADRLFWLGLGAVSGLYLLLLAGMLLADVAYVFSGRDGGPNPLMTALSDPNIRSSIHLTLVSCSITAILAVGLSAPTGYLLSRREFPGKPLVDTLFDVPIALPPLVIGLSLLILFQWAPASIRDAVVYQTPAVILAQLVVASAFAVRTMRTTFGQIDPRDEEVARTLGATRLQAFAWVALPAARHGVIAAGLLAWARALGEFGPLLVFAGATRGKTEVLSTTVFLELNLGNLQAAVAVSLLMIVAAVLVLTGVRVLGSRPRP